MENEDGSQISDEGVALVPTPEQHAIIDAARRADSFMVSAGAGSAKTTTLKMLSQVLRSNSILGVAFNVKIVEDLTAAMPDQGSCEDLEWPRPRGLGEAAGQVPPQWIRRS